MWRGGCAIWLHNGWALLTCRSWHMLPMWKDICGIWYSNMAHYAVQTSQYSGTMRLHKLQNGHFTNLSLFCHVLFKSIWMPCTCSQENFTCVLCSLYNIPQASSVLCKSPALKDWQQINFDLTSVAARTSKEDNRFFEMALLDAKQNIWAAGNCGKRWARPCMAWPGI